MLLAGIALRKGQLLFVAVGRLGQGNEQIAVGKMECCLDRVGQTCADVVLHDQTVDDDLDRVFFVFVKGDLLGQLIHGAVDADADITRLFCVLKDLFMHTLFAADDGRKDDELGSCGQLADLVKNLVDGLLADLLAADRTVRNADARIEQTQIVVDLGDGTDRGSRVFRGGLLVDGDRGGQTLDAVHIGLVQLSQEHAGIRGQRFDEAAVTLGVDRIKRQGRFARSRHAREDDELVARDGQIDVF